MSRLAEMQARFQQRQMQEKEEKLLRLYENQQQRAFDKVSRGSSGSSGGTSPVGINTGPGKVRQMFDERRQKAGIDRSYPLEPLKQTVRLNGHSTVTRVSSLDRSNTLNKNPTPFRQSVTTMKSTVQRTVSHGAATKPMKSHTVRQTTNATYTNGKLIEENSTYEERNNDHNANMSQQQKELEALMNKHNIKDNIENEELPDVDIDEVDNMKDVNENDRFDRKYLSNGEVNSSTSSTPTKKTPSTRSSSGNSSPGKEKQITNSKSRTTTIKNSPSRTIKVQNGEKKPIMKPVKNTNARAMPVTSTVSNKSTSRGPRVPHLAVTKDDLVECKYCQRRFAADRLTVHEDICARTAKKKRKAYDATKHRVQGTDVESYAKRGPKGTIVKAKPSQMPKSDWRRQHEEFISTIRAAKQVQAHVAAGGKVSDLPPPPPSLNPDYVQCPHCNRRFNEAAAARHIPKCANMMHNKPNRLGAQPPKKRY